MLHIFVLFSYTEKDDKTRAQALYENRTGDGDEDRKKEDFGDPFCRTHHSGRIWAEGKSR